MANVCRWLRWPKEHGGGKLAGRCRRIRVCLPIVGHDQGEAVCDQQTVPTILYQVLQEVETEGYACRKLYCDTFKVNFSSAGTPQEMAYTENAVKTIAAMSRSLMAGAPHLKGISRPARSKCSPRDAPAITKQHEPLRVQTKERT